MEMAALRKKPNWPLPCSNLVEAAQLCYIYLSLSAHYTTITSCLAKTMHSDMIKSGDMGRVCRKCVLQSHGKSTSSDTFDRYICPICTRWLKSASNFCEHDAKNVGDSSVETTMYSAQRVLIIFIFARKPAFVF